VNSLLQLIQCGQSYWMDNLSRGMIQTGALTKRIFGEGLRGITSNPAIFNRAISKSRAYDAQIQALARRKMPVEGIYEELAIKDIQDACDFSGPFLMNRKERMDMLVSRFRLPGR
jgi:transaldolase